jgi:hypothetical protein
MTHLAIAFAIAHPDVTSAIIGPRTMEQLDDLLAGIDVRLSDEILDRPSRGTAAATSATRSSSARCGGRGHGPGEPTDPVRWGMGGGGGGGRWRQDFWVWPLPPSGPVGSPLTSSLSAQQRPDRCSRPLAAGREQPPQAYNAAAGRQGRAFGQRLRPVPDGAPLTAVSGVVRLGHARTPPQKASYANRNGELIGPAGKCGGRRPAVAARVAAEFRRSALGQGTAVAAHVHVDS